MLDTGKHCERLFTFLFVASSVPALSLNQPGRLHDAVKADRRRLLVLLHVTREILR
jgi:hypothetical protein